MGAGARARSSLRSQQRRSDGIASLLRKGGIRPAQNAAYLSEALGFSIHLKATQTLVTLTQALSLREREFLSIPHPASRISHLASRIRLSPCPKPDRAIVFLDL